MKSYKEKNYEQALIEAYLKFDELLRNDKVNDFLKAHQNNHKKIPLTSFDYAPIEIDLNTSISYVKSPTMQLEILGGCNNSNNNADGVYENLSTKSKRSSDSSQSMESLSFDNCRLEISMRYLHEAKQNDLIASNMGTTANILLIKNNYIYLANVGDSLAVLYRNGEAVKLNQEHKTSLESEYMRINKSGAKIINNRIEGRLNLTRAIGMLFLTYQVICLLKIIQT
jgi:hypothetical protein